MRRTKRVKVAELKTHLSRYLRDASRGTTIVVCSRDEPVARLVPPVADEDDPDDARRARLIAEGKLKPGKGVPPKRPWPRRGGASQEQIDSVMRWVKGYE
jgi:prevent-host-death family protein